MSKWFRNLENPPTKSDNSTNSNRVVAVKIKFVSIVIITYEDKFGINSPHNFYITKQHFMDQKVFFSEPKTADLAPGSSSPSLSCIW